MGSDYQEFKQCHSFGQIFLLAGNSALRSSINVDVGVVVEEEGYTKQDFSEDHYIYQKVQLLIY